jgi:hypothetical protein
MNPCFDVVEGLAWSNDPEIYAGSRVATGKTHAREVKGNDPGKKRYRGLPCGGLGVWLTEPSHKK